MTQEELYKALCKAYPKISPSVFKGYLLPDEVIYVNDGDPDMKKIPIPLPKAPDVKEWHKIDGFGKTAKQQKFVSQVIPDRVKALQSSGKPLDTIWDELKKNFREYINEITWIKKQIRRRFMGYWFFNNGKLTYMVGWHYIYCNYWKLGSYNTEYRERDRKFFLFAEMCYKDVYCFGFAYPKHRQEGATSKTSCIGHELVSTNIKKHMGIQSKDDDSAEKVYQQNVLEPFKELPFFLKAQFDGSTSPKSMLRFERPAIRTGSREGALSNVEGGLGSSIFFAPANAKKFDTWSNMIFYYQDETGKSNPSYVDIYDRWNKVKPALHQGSKIHGFSIATSTVDEMSKGGGQQFLNYCKRCDYHDRLPNGQTASGLYLLFITAEEGHPDFVDEYGNSVVLDPTPDQARYLKKKWIASGKPEEKYRPIGSRQAFQEHKESLLKAGDIEGFSEFCRQFPVKYADCWRMSQKDSGFDLVSIENRLSELRFSQNQRRNGDFEWVNEFGGHVIWVDKPDHATTESKFWMSISMDGELYKPNNRAWDEDAEMWIPLNKQRFIAGADGFNFNKTKDSRQSPAALVVRERRNVNIDSEDKPLQDWITPRWVLVYKNRPSTKDEVAEDMLKMCIYMGCQVSIEQEGSPFLYDYIVQYHPEFKGYLYYKFEQKRGEYSQVPGENLKSNRKGQIFHAMQQHMKYHVHKEVHLEILNDCRDIAGLDDMKNRDVFAACGQTLLADDPVYEQMEKLQAESTEVTDFFHDISRGL